VKPAPKLAIHGGTPIRQEMLPYARQSLDEDDINAVLEVLRSDWLTTGPQVAAFEQDFAAVVGARQAVAVTASTTIARFVTSVSCAPAERRRYP